MSRFSTVPAANRTALAARHPTWREGTLSQALDAAAAEHPDAAFVITDERSFSYAEVEAWAERIARGLLALGVRPGDHVALVMANVPEFVAIKFAIARAGAVCIPINFLLRAEELRYVLGQSDACVLITMDTFRDLDYLAALDEITPGWEEVGGGRALPGLEHVVVLGIDGSPPSEAMTLIELERLGGRGGEIPEPGGSGDVCDILYTSGTTGHPKGVLITHDMVLRTAYGSAYQRGLGIGHRIVFALPMYHVFGYLECLLPAMYVGGAVVPHLIFDAAATLRAIERHRVDELVCVPTMTLAILDAARSGRYDLTALRTVFSSGGVAPDGIWEQIRAVLKPTWITTGYGMTETTAATTCTMPEGPDELLRTTNGMLRDAGVAGDPVLGGRLAEYKAVDPRTRADLPFGEAGELLVRGPVVTAGYYEKPEETAAAFADGDGWLRTGDIGSIAADGTLVLCGRLKETYRCGGELVMPLEVENLLASHPSVLQAFVVGVPDLRMGEIGCAWIVPTPGAEVDAEELAAWCSRRLARFKVPRHVLAITPQEVPVTATGRPQKFRLAELAKERIADAVTELV